MSESSFSTSDWQESPKKRQKVGTAESSKENQATAVGMLGDLHYRPAMRRHLHRVSQCMLPQTLKSKPGNLP